MSLGTSDFVFTYAGPFRYPPASACGFLFDPSVEAARITTSSASPFDSGGLVDYMRPADSEQARRGFLRDHDLPVPEYRTYFSLVVSALFGAPKDYLTGVAPDHRGPIDLVGGDSRAWTFEIRFNEELSIHDSLLAVFVPVAVLDAEWAAPQLVEWRRRHVQIEPYIHQNDGLGGELLAASIRYIEAYLG